MKSVVAGVKWYATKLARTPWLLSKSSALSSCSPPPVGLKGPPICSDVSHNHVDSSAKSVLKSIVLFHRDRFFQFLLPFPSAILCCIYAESLPPATTCSYYSLYQVWQTWAYSLVFVQLACWHTNVSRWSGGQPWRLSQFHRRKHCWCAHTTLPANFQCSHHVVLVSFCIMCSLLWSPFDFCNLFGHRNGPCNCHHFSPSMFMSPRNARVVQTLS